MTIDRTKLEAAIAYIRNGIDDDATFPGCNTQRGKMFLLLAAAAEAYLATLPAEPRHWIVLGCAGDQVWIANPTTPLLTETEAQIKMHDLRVAFPGHFYSMIRARGYDLPEMRA